MTDVSATTGRAGDRVSSTSSEVAVETTSQALTNGAAKEPLAAVTAEATATATVTATTTATVTATTTAATATMATAVISKQAKSECHSQSNNNQHVETAPSKQSSDSEASAPTTVSIPSANAKINSSSSGKTTATQQDVDEVARLFEEKPEAFEKWLTERAPPEALSRLHEFIESRKPHKRPSVTSDLFQQWMASPTVQQVGVS